MKKNYFLLLLGSIICAFGQPAWVPFLGYFAATIGLALCWYAIKNIAKNKKQIFYLSFLFFAILQAVQLSWMTSTKYQTNYILIIYGSILVSTALEFALLTLFVTSQKSKNIFTAAAAASIWTIFEWIRLWPLCGYSWNPLGLYLTNNHYSLQLASLGGVYLLSFFVILINTITYQALINKDVKKLPFICFLSLVPFAFGFIHQSINNTHSKILKAALVQTALTPEERTPMPEYDIRKFIPPHEQWQKIFSLLSTELKNKQVDLIVLPESAVPLQYNQEFFPLNYALTTLDTFFPPIVTIDNKTIDNAKNHKIYPTKNVVSNNFFAQSIANYFQADVIIGMDKENYNAALVYHPNTIKIESYEKRVLLPIVEYFPFSWVKNLAAKFGITGAYTHGSTNKIFAGKIANFSISICYEETFGHLLHDNRNIGAQLLVNISNDAWFPNSKLPKQHFDLGKIRTVENGLPLIRACNTGITAGINAFGETISILDKKENQNGLLLLNVPLASYPTLYSLLGDYLILSVSGLFILLFLFSRKHRKN